MLHETLCAIWDQTYPLDSCLIEYFFLKYNHPRRQITHKNLNFCYLIVKFLIEKYLKEIIKKILQIYVFLLINEILSNLNQ